MSAFSRALKGAQTFVVRPYAGIEAVKGSLDLAEVVVAGVSHPPGRVVLDPKSFPLADATVSIYFDAETLGGSLLGMGLNSSVVRLAIIAYGSVVAEHAILDDRPLAEIDSPMEVSLKGAPLIMDSPIGFDVRAFLYLGQDVKSDGLAPTRAGTWLAHVDFVIQPYSSFTRFSPTPMRAEDRKAWGLPKGCVSYIKIGDGLIEADSLEDEVEVLVDFDVLNLLQERPSEPLSEYMQLELATATVTAIVGKTSSLLRERAESESIGDLRERGLPVARLVDAVAQAAGVQADEVLALTEDDPGRVRSFCEAFVDLSKRAVGTLKEVR